MVAQKRAPALGWWPRLAAHIPSDCRLSDLEAELEQFTMNVWGAPEWVRPAHLANQRAQLCRDLRSANRVTRSPAPICSKPSAVPANGAPTSGGRCRTTAIPAKLFMTPFLGSGTSLIAAETTGRVCLGMELEPRYVDVAVRRWKAFTGLDACLRGDGRSFAVVAAERLAGLQTTNLGPASTRPVETAVKNDPAAT